MFGKDKVKGHNRVIKTKKGLKVTRVGDFLRKKDENRNRNIALGVGATAILGVGTALLLKKKGVKFPGQVNKKNSLAKGNDNVVVPKSNNVPSPGEKFIKEMDEEFGILPNTTKPKVTNDVENIVKNASSKNSKLENPLDTPTFKPEPILDPWDTAITTKIDSSINSIINLKSKNIPLLTGKKIPASRGNLYGFDNRIARRVAKKAASDATRIDNMEKAYRSISPDNLAMRASIKIDHYLKRPRKTSNLGAPPKPTSLEKVVSNPKTKQAQKKVEDRLARAERQLQKKASDVKKNKKMM